VDAVWAHSARSKSTHTHTQRHRDAWVTKRNFRLTSCGSLRIFHDDQGWCEEFDIAVLHDVGLSGLGFNLCNWCCQQLTSDVFKSLTKPKPLKAKHKHIWHVLDGNMTDICMRVLLHAVLDTGSVWSANGLYFSFYVRA